MPGGFDSFAKTLMILGAVLLAAGALLWLGGKFSFLGRLPGDLHFEKGNFSVYFPIATSILLSIVLTVVLNLFFRR